MSFTLNRVGLKEAHYIPLRLRFVDSLSIVSGVPLLVLIFAAVFQSFQLANLAGLGNQLQNVVAFFAYLIAAIWFWAWILSKAWIAALRLLLQLTGLLKSEEARSFPLRADKHCVDPWPDSWQKQIECRANDKDREELRIDSQLK